MRKLLILLVAILFYIDMAAAQSQISGKVTDINGLPLPGVSVKVKNSNLGTSTGNDGLYSITLPKGFTTLIFSSVGFEDKEIIPSGTTIIDIILTASVKNLNEVVVVGYGTRLKRDVTSSVAKVTSKEFQNLPLPTFEQALQGRASGVYINTGSGKLGQALNIRVRGISSISANQQPFVVIDGVPIVNQAIGSDDEPDNPLATINPDDIESIEVLKDASSAAIYGSRASNGVLLITTKSGKQGKTHLNVGFYTGWSTPTKKRDFLNAAQYRELFDSAAHYIGSTGEAEFNGNTGTNDWNSNNDTKWSHYPI